MLARWPVARRRRDRSRTERGAVAVEFALVLPVLVMLMFGIFTTGRSYADHLAITNAVREGARLGSAINYSTGAAQWANDVQQRVQDVYDNGTNTLPLSNICVRLEDTAGVALATPSSQGTSCGSAPGSPTTMATGSCVVKVWVQKPAEISLLLSPTMDFNIGADSVSYYARAVGSCAAS